MAAMTVGELKEKLNDFDDDLPVVIRQDENESDAAIDKLEVIDRDNAPYCKSDSIFDWGLPDAEKALFIRGWDG